MEDVSALRVRTGLMIRDSAAAFSFQVRMRPMEYDPKLASFHPHDRTRLAWQKATLEEKCGTHESHWTLGKVIVVSAYTPMKKLETIHLLESLSDSKILGSFDRNRVISVSDSAESKEIKFITELDTGIFVLVNVGPDSVDFFELAEVLDPKRILAVIGDSEHEYRKGIADHHVVCFKFPKGLRPPYGTAFDESRTPYVSTKFKVPDKKTLEKK